MFGESSIEVGISDKATLASDLIHLMLLPTLWHMDKMITVGSSCLAAPSAATLASASESTVARATRQPYHSG